MANRTAILAIRIVSDASGASRGFDEAAGGMSKMEKAGAAAVAGATVVLGALAAMGTAAFNAASDLEQATGAVESVFGAAADEVKALSAAASQSVGLASAEYSNLASVLGAALGNLGISQEEIVGTTDSLITKGADLAATFGGTTADAVSALSALFRGEADPMERYGVSIKQSDINARLAAEGLSGLEGEAKKTAETQARLALLTEQTAAATGQFARESDTAAGQQQRLSAEFTNAKAALGEALLPLVSGVANAFADMAGWASQNVGLVQTIAVVVGALAVAVYAVAGAMAVWHAAVAISTAVQWLWNAALTANPLGILIVAIVAVVAALVWFFTQTEAGRAIVSAVADAMVAAWNGVKAAVGWVIDKVGELIEWIGGKLSGPVSAVGGFFSSAFGVAKSVIEAVGGAISTVIGWISSLIGWISRISWPSPPGWLSALFGGGMPELMAVPPGGPTFMADPFLAFDHAGPDLTAAASNPLAGLLGAFGRGGGGSVQITNNRVEVTGAIDPQSTAHQIHSLLTGRDRTLGRTNARAL